jgi:hypothetical protein
MCFILKYQDISAKIGSDSQYQNTYYYCNILYSVSAASENIRTDPNEGAALLLY